MLNKKTFQNFNYCEEQHRHHLSNPQMILAKTLVAKFSNCHGSAGSSIAASSDTWQKVWECLIQMQVIGLSLNFKVAS